MFFPGILYRLRGVWDLFFALQKMVTHVLTDKMKKPSQTAGLFEWSAVHSHVVPMVGLEHTLNIVFNAKSTVFKNKNCAKRYFCGANK